MQHLLHLLQYVHLDRIAQLQRQQAAFSQFLALLDHTIHLLNRVHVLHVRSGIIANSFTQHQLLIQLKQTQFQPEVLVKKTLVQLDTIVLILNLSLHFHAKQALIKVKQGKHLAYLALLDFFVQYKECRFLLLVLIGFTAQ